MLSVFVDLALIIFGVFYCVGEIVDIKRREAIEKRISVIEEILYTVPEEKEDK